MKNEFTMPDADDAIPEDVIQRRSYQIWERENRPRGKHLSHWLRAKAELRSERLQRMRSGEIQVGQGSIYFWDYYG